MTDHTEKRCRDCDGYNCDNGCAYPPKDTEMQIPDDVMEAARDLLAEWGMEDKNDLYASFAGTLVMQERERCARIAESVGNYGDYKREELTKDYGQPRFDLMHDIVAAIRGSVDK